MPTGLHKRSFSSSHLTGGGTKSTKSINHSKTAEELAELMNKANACRKASRNVLNDVKRKGEMQEHIN